MLNYIQNGAILEHQNNTEITIKSGDILVYPSGVVGVAAVDIEAADNGSVCLTGVYDLPVAAGTTCGQLSALFYDEVAKCFTTDDTKTPTTAKSWQEFTGTEETGRIKLS